MEGGERNGIFDDELGAGGKGLASQSERRERGRVAEGKGFHGDEGLVADIQNLQVLRLCV